MLELRRLAKDVNTHCVERMRMCIAALIVALLPSARGVAQAPGAPPTRVENVVDVLHGVRVPDPYRWREDQDSPDTRAWLAAQTAYARRVLDSAPGRSRIRELVDDHQRRAPLGLPFGSDGRRFLYSRMVPGQPNPNYYLRHESAAEEELVLAARTDAEGRPLQLRFHGLSPDGTILAYGLRSSGSELTEIQFLEVASRRTLPDRLPTGIYSPMFFIDDGSGVYFINRQPSGHRLLFHRFGTESSADKEVFVAEPGRILLTTHSSDGRFTAAFVNEGAGRGARTKMYLLDRANGGRFMPLLDQAAGTFRGAFGGHTLFLQTTWNAPNGRVISVDALRPDAPVMEIVAESPQRVLNSMQLAAESLVLLTMEDVQRQLYVVNPRTAASRRVDVPPGTISEVAAFGWTQRRIFFTLTSITQSAAYTYDVVADQRRLWSADEKGPSDQIESKQVWYASKDGTRVPMFLFHKKGLVLNGDQPTLLSAYGGYGAITLPYGTPEAATWVQLGGVYAFASIRGGGELGDAWHKAGMLSKKQNSFDDFIAAAEWLVRNKYTRPERLGISGASNGGMLVAVAALQRPELFRAVMSRAPHLDMVRYHRFLAAAPWVTEFGSPDIAEEFAYLYRYSPYHNVKKGTRYPAMMFVTGDADTRVAPLHARKMTGQLQAASSSGLPVLLRYDVQTGHGGAASAAENADRLTDELAFLSAQVALEVASPKR